MVSFHEFQQSPHLTSANNDLTSASPEMTTSGPSNNDLASAYHSDDNQGGGTDVGPTPQSAVTSNAPFASLSSASPLSSQQGVVRRGQARKHFPTTYKDGTF